MKEQDLASLPGLSKETQPSASLSSRDGFHPISHIHDSPRASFNLSVNSGLLQKSGSDCSSQKYSTEFTAVLKQEFHLGEGRSNTVAELSCPGCPSHSPSPESQGGLF